MQLRRQDIRGTITLRLEHALAQAQEQPTKKHHLNDLRLLKHTLPLLCLLLYCAGCSEKKPPDAAPPSTPPTTATTSTEPSSPPLTLTGEQLARIHCAKCHQYPEPDLLDKKTWREVLVMMGSMFGIYYTDTIRPSLLGQGETAKRVEAANIFPPHRILDQASWAAIQGHYTNNAPETPLPGRKTEIPVTLKRFEVHKPKLEISPPGTSLVYLTNHSALFIGDSPSSNLFQFSKDLKVLKQGRLGEGIVWINDAEDGYWTTVMGSFAANDDAKGMVMRLPKYKGQKAHVALTGLQRPVHTSLADLDGDQHRDLVVCEFGKFAGALNWWRNLGNDTYEKITLRPKAGAIRSYIRDLNNDGLPDVIALFAQGDEGIFAFYNKGDRTFEERRLLQFNPAQGSSFFDLYDFNGDGFEDIIYTAGDNADYGPIFKRYHGVYVFTNDGNYTFQQSFFFHVNGAYNAIARDFDLDGDVDMAVISFFPDFHNQPEESFVYLENQGDSGFTAATFEDPVMGRWLVMDAGDWDNDGDQDLVLGSKLMEVIPREGGLFDRWIKDGLPFIVLENKTK